MLSHHSDLTEARGSYQAHVHEHGKESGLAANARALVSHQKKCLDKSRKQLCKLTRVAKQSFFEDFFKKSHPHLISDFVAWTKPRKTDANIQLKRQDGSAAKSADNLKEIFQEQFMPANLHAVDASILSEYPQKEELSFPSIGEVEIMNNL